MSIDFSKKPEGATHAATMQHPSQRQCWYKKMPSGGWRYSYGDDERWEVVVGDPSWTPLIEMPVDWTGEGLPPAGIACEVLWDSQLGIYVSVAVLAHDEAGAVYRFTTGGRKGEYQSEQQDHYKGLPKFRPIRTPEQIAAEERKLQREQLAYLIAGYMGFDDPRETDTKLAAYIFDHEYRKQVAP